MCLGISKVLPRICARPAMPPSFRNVAPTASSLLVGFAKVVLMLEAAPCSPEVPDAPLAPLALVELELLPHAANPRAAAMTATTRARRTNVVLSVALTRRAQ